MALDYHAKKKIEKGRKSEHLRIKNRVTPWETYFILRKREENRKDETRGERVIEENTKKT